MPLDAEQKRSASDGVCSCGAALQGWESEGGSRHACCTCMTARLHNGRILPRIHRLNVQHVLTVTIEITAPDPFHPTMHSSIHHHSFILQSLLCTCDACTGHFITPAHCMQSWYDYRCPSATCWQ